METSSGFKLCVCVYACVCVRVCECARVSSLDTLVSSCWIFSPPSCFSDLQWAAWQPFAHPRKIPLQAVRTWVMAALRLTGSDGSRLMLGHQFAFSRRHIFGLCLQLLCSAFSLLHAPKAKQSAAASHRAVFRRNGHLFGLPTVCLWNASNPPQFKSFSFFSSLSSAFCLPRILNPKHIVFMF